MREKPDIPEDHLRASLQNQYGLSAVTFEFLPLGLDMNAGIYRLVSEQRTSYLLKAKAGPFYEPGCFVSRYLRDQGIAAVVAPLPTTGNALWTQVGGWTVIVYPFIEGETGWNAVRTDEQWRSVGTTLHQIHQITLPAEGFRSLRKETFDPTRYRRSVRAFETQHIRAEGGSQAEQALRSHWIAHQPMIHTAVAALEKLAGVLQKRSGPHVICHADLHPGNIIRDHANRIFVIDWDDVMLAPKERDFLFIGEARANGSARQDTAAFFRGYGQAEIDWTALTYYLWERLIQDVIAFAEEVFSRPDLEETTKADSAAWFHAILAEEGNKAEQALAAAVHLPADLSLHNRSDD